MTPLSTPITIRGKHRDGNVECQIGPGQCKADDEKQNRPRKPFKPRRDSFAGHTRTGIRSEGHLPYSLAFSAGFFLSPPFVSDSSAEPASFSAGAGASTLI